MYEASVRLVTVLMKMFVEKTMCLNLHAARCIAAVMAYGFIAWEFMC